MVYYIYFTTCKFSYVISPSFHPITHPLTFFVLVKHFYLELFINCNIITLNKHLYQLSKSHKIQVAAAVLTSNTSTPQTHTGLLLKSTLRPELVCKD